MTVIYSNFGDPDTKVLRGIWGGLDTEVIEVENRRNNPEHFQSSTKIKEAISKEGDTLIIVGHGSSEGCWDPTYGYTFDSSCLPYLKAKNVIGIWCHASDFARKYNVKGFFSEMFISNIGEASYVLPKETFISQKIQPQEITDSEIKFCKILNDLLKKKVPLKDWKDSIENLTDKDFAVENYNYSHTRYFE